MDLPVNKKFTFHVVGLPHTQTTREYTACAYTEKVRKFCDMMKSLGHTVYLYASEENEAAVDELITIYPKADQQKWFGNHDFKSKMFNLTWGTEDEHWKIGNLRAVREIAKRSGKDDIICLIGGVCQKSIADTFPELKSVEFGIGYRGTFAKYRVYESNAWMHHNMGVQNRSAGDPNFVVIPNYWDPKEFEPVENPSKDYFLFIGRMIKSKGIHTAVTISEETDTPLLMAGQGVKNVLKLKNGMTVMHLDDTVIEGSQIEHLGYVMPEQRRHLMANAKAVIVATDYLEPFGGVHAEALLCGTPVITTDWGVFTETVQEGFNGYRTRTLPEAVYAAGMVDELDRKSIRSAAIFNFGMDRVKYLYQAYFEQITDDEAVGNANYNRYAKSYN